MNPEQDNTGSFEMNPALEGDLPEVFVQRQYDARFGFGEAQKDNILPSRAIGPGPKDIVAIGTKRLDNRLWKVLISQDAHLGWDRKGLVFVGQVAGVR